VKLIFDENLSPRLPYLLANEYPGSIHVRGAGLLSVADRQIWSYASANGFAIVSKDTDFRERSFVEGAPPKVIWLDVGNAGTAAIAYLLQRELTRVLAFDVDAETALLMLSLGPRAI
jgi:predicted nuclease of predicted toxin-antitoxin system